MRHFRPAAASFILLFALAATAQDVWRSDTGQPLPETSFRRTVNGFGAIMAFTGQPDWQEQVLRADGPHGWPVIKATDGVAINGKVWLIVVFTNPLPDDKGRVVISAHVVITLPNGKVAIDEPRIVCWNGPISGAAQLVRICDTNMQLGIDAGDPTGGWRVAVTIRDENRKTDVPLEDILAVRDR